MTTPDDYLSDADGLPWERIPGTNRWRRPEPRPAGEPAVELPEAYLAAEFGGLHTVPDDGTDPWKDA